MKTIEKFGTLSLAPILASIGAVAITPIAAHAQVQELGEVVVTAERRTENIQRLPSSVSVRSGDALEAEGKYSLRSILEDIPGVVGGAALSPVGVVASGSDNLAAGLTIRGIPSNVGVGGTVSSVPSSAAIYVDGIYEGAGGSYDIDRVEVLRGPQGTLYGRSATSGLVAIHTRDPELGDFGGNVSAEFGNYDLRRYSGAVNVPLGDKAALRISGNRYLRDGFYAPKDGNYANSKDLRVKFLVEPTDNLSILVGAAAQDNITSANGVNIYLTAPDSQYRFEYVSNGIAVPASPGKNSTRQYWAEFNWDFGFASLSYLPAFRSFESSSLTSIRNASASQDQTIKTPEDYFITHELRLASGPESKLKWQLGSLLYDNTVKNSSRFVYKPAGSLRRNTDTQRDTEAWGVFAEATYPLSDSWRVTGGLRYDETKVAVTQTLTVNQTVSTAANFTLPTAGFPEILTSKTLSGAAGEREFTNTTYKARIEHDLTAQNMIYAMTSSAASPGDISLATDVTNQPVVRELRSYIMKAYEIGSKSRFFDNRVQVNGSVFFNDYAGYQVLNVNVNPVPPPAGQSVFETLVAPVEVVGAEFEVQFQPTANDRIGFDIGYTHSYFSDRSQLTSFGTKFGTYFGRSNVPGVVPLTVHVSYDHTFHPFEGSRLTVGGDIRYLSAHDADRILGTQTANAQLASVLMPYIRADAEVVADLNASWSFADGKYTVNGWVRNVTDNRYKTSVNVTGVTSANLNTPGQGLNNIMTNSSAPRTWGISLNAKF